MPLINATNNSTASPAQPPPKPIEPHYKVAEIAELWNISEDTVRRIFRDERGVLKIGKRQGHYCVLRIPESVLVRVQDRLTQNGKAAAGVLHRLRPQRELRAS